MEGIDAAINNLMLGLKRRGRAPELDSHLDLDEMRGVSALRCSALTWACVLGKPWAVRDLLAEPSSWVRGNKCGHSITFEVVVAVAAAVSQVRDGVKGLPFVETISELIEYVQKIGKPSYILDILRFVREGILVTVDSSENEILVTLQEKIAKLISAREISLEAAVVDSWMVVV